MEYVYHVVTERPMHFGQRIVFDDEHHNGVYHRVMTCKRLMDGEKINSELATFLQRDLSKWNKISLRELALEQVRQAEYPHYPSRMACLYTSRSLNEAKKWADFFQKSGRKVYSIVKLRVDGSVFDADACNCFDGTENVADNLEKARHYWAMGSQTPKPVIETLVSGNIIVDEIIIDYSLK